MEVSFKTRNLQKQCNSHKKCVKTFGQICADKIRARLDELLDSPNLATLQNLPQARFHALRENRKGQYALDVQHPKRIVIKPDHDPIPTLPDGGDDLEMITRVLVIEIDDYH